MSSGLFKMLNKNYVFINHIFDMNIYKQDLALNNLQRLICHKTQPNNQPGERIVAVLYLMIKNNSNFCFLSVKCSSTMAVMSLMLFLCIHFMACTVTYCQRAITLEETGRKYSKANSFLSFFLFFFFFFFHTWVSQKFYNIC